MLGALTLVFLGLSFIPMMGGLFGDQPPTPAPDPDNPTASPTADPANMAQELQAEEKGYQLVLDREATNQTALKGLAEARLKLIRLGLRQPQDVIEPLKKLAETNPAELQYAVLLAQSQQQAGNPDAAMQTYRTVLAQSPTNLQALQGYTALLLAAQKPEEALGLLQEAIATAKQPNATANAVDVPALELLVGDVYMAQQKVPAALALYEKLTQENPNDFRPVLAKGLVLRDQGQSPEAIALFQKAKTMAPAQFKDQIQQIIASAESAGTNTPRQSTGAPGTPGLTPAPQPSATP